MNIFLEGISSYLGKPLRFLTLRDIQRQVTEPFTGKIVLIIYLLLSREFVGSLTSEPQTVHDRGVQCHHYE